MNIKTRYIVQSLTEVFVHRFHRSQSSQKCMMCHFYSGLFWLIHCYQFLRDNHGTRQQAYLSWCRLTKLGCFIRLVILISWLGHLIMLLQVSCIFFLMKCFFTLGDSKWQAKVQKLDIKFGMTLFLVKETEGSLNISKKLKMYSNFIHVMKSRVNMVTKLRNYQKNIKNF